MSAHNKRTLSVKTLVTNTILPRTAGGSVRVGGITQAAGTPPSHTESVTALEVYADTFVLGADSFRTSFKMQPPTPTQSFSATEFSQLFFDAFGHRPAVEWYTSSVYAQLDLTQMRSFLDLDGARTIGVGKGDKFNVFDRQAVLRSHALAWYMNADPPGGWAVPFGMMHYHTAAAPTVVVPACFCVDGTKTLWISVGEAKVFSAPDPTWTIEFIDV